mmetsp:Transcript_1129/g.2947  ORF Transcript_1129/g.2947 Transcript_1129/m.2947 type:complete len:226 (-) Transcript_1129:40-717(-)
MAQKIRDVDRRLAGRSAGRLHLLHVLNRPAALARLLVEVVHALVLSIPTLHDRGVQGVQALHLGKGGDLQAGPVHPPLLEGGLHLRRGEPCQQAALDGHHHLAGANTLAGILVNTGDGEAELRVLQRQAGARGRVHPQSLLPKGCAIPPSFRKAGAQLLQLRVCLRCGGIHVVAEAEMAKLEDATIARTVKGIRGLEEVSAACCAVCRRGDSSHPEALLWSNKQA